MFWIAGLLFEGLPRAAVNIDYLVVGALVPFAGAAAAVGMMSCAMLVDVFRCSGPIYYFSQRDSIEALAYIKELTAKQVLETCVLVIVPIVMTSWLLVRLGGTDRKLRSNSLAVAMSVLVLGVIGVWGGNSSLRVSDAAVTPNLTTSAGVSMAKTVWGALTRKAGHVESVPIDSATRRVKWLERTPATQNVVLVIVESGGMPKEPRWRELIADVFNTEEIWKRYSVETGVVPFSGATVPGEVRELCGISSGVMERPAVDALKNCLPNRLRSNGYRTLYTHGFRPEMFDRLSWLPKMGFDETLFHSQLRQSGLPDCGGPFRGTCDAALGQWIGQRLEAEPEQKHFFAFLTLNSHLPVTADEDSSAILGCGTPGAEIEDEASCDLMGLVIRAERSIAEVAVRPNLPPTEFLIVGDHAPPFVRRARREEFSATEVPFVHLVPRVKSSFPKQQ